MGEIKLDSDSLNLVIMKAVVDNITEEQRNEFIKEAIKHLLEPKRDSYTYKTESPLMAYFREAVRKACEAVATEMVDNSTELQDQLRASIQNAITGVINDPDSKLRELVGQAVANAISKKSWDD